MDKTQLPMIQLPPIPPPAYSKKALAELCNVSVRTVQIWMYQRGLPHCKVGAVAMILRDDLVEFLKQHRNPSAEKHHGIPGE